MEKNPIDEKLLRKEVEAEMLRRLKRLRWEAWAYQVVLGFGIGWFWDDSRVAVFSMTFFAILMVGIIKFINMQIFYLKEKNHAAKSQRT